MIQPIALTRQYAISPALKAEDFAHAAALGFRTVVNYLPDDEANALSVHAARRAAEASGLVFVHLPAAKYDLLTPDLLSKVRKALDGGCGPVLGMCASGQRAAIVWAGAMARSMPVDDILKVLAGAGLDLGFLRDDLETEAHRSLWAIPVSDSAKFGARAA